MNGLMFSILEKERLFDRVMAAVLGDPELGLLPPRARCVFFAAETVRAIRALGVRAILQAGSAGWPRVRPEQDDGKLTTATHFSYMWSPHERLSREAMAAGFMPELHAWVAVPRTDEIVDLTTCYWPEQARAIGGYAWPGALPPRFFWGGAKHLPVGVFYRPEPEAIRFVLKAAAQFYGKNAIRTLV